LEVVGEQVVIAIEDNGPGIRPEDAKRLFEKFYRSEKMRHVPGSGLGLYLAYQVALFHRGSLSAGPSELGGAKFVFQMPLAASPGTAHL
jgi:signal transduction histidine kinase